jgi:hypothetical protein
VFPEALVWEVRRMAVERPRLDNPFPGFIFEIFYLAFQMKL